MYPWCWLLLAVVVVLFHGEADDTVELAALRDDSDFCAG